MFTENNVHAFIDAIQESNIRLFFDATGSVMKNIENKGGRVLLYSIVMNDGGRAVPLMNAITEDHKTANASLCLQKFMEAKDRITKSKRTTAGITIDFSWPMINSVISVFNKTDIHQYLLKTYNACFDTVNIPTRVNICSAHLLHTESRKLRSDDVSRETRILILNLIGTYILETNINAFKNSLHNV